MFPGLGSVARFDNPVTQPRFRQNFPAPFPPIFCLAPLDVWFRFLLNPRPKIGIRYWPRVLVGLALSAVSTLITLPERLVVGVCLRLRRPRGPAPVVILGYYRSGTTFLQFLLDRDPALVSPKWNEALAPQGYVLSWTFLRFLLLPFLGGNRPQDNVSFGSDFPAEDDFALCNWAMASSLPSRHVVPSMAPHYSRFDDLDTLGAAEHARWSWHQRALVEKLLLLRPGRRVLLKSPCHTARVRHLLALFGPDTRFIYISRHPHAVFRSNIALFDSLDPIYHLEDPVSREELERRVLADYLGTEARYLADRGLIPPGRLAEVRLADLQADPIGEVGRLYRELDLPMSEHAVERMRLYLEGERDYRGNSHAGWTEEEKARFEPPLAELVRRYESGGPTKARVPTGPPANGTHSARNIRLAWGTVLAIVAGLSGALAWGSIMWLLGRPCHPIWCWPIGVVAGLLARWPAGRGSPVLGLVAAMAACASLPVAAWTAAHLRGGSHWLEWLGNPVGLPEWLFGPNVAFWLYAGAMSGWKLATRRW